MNSLGGKFVTLKISATYRDFPNHFFREIPVNKWFYCKYDYFQSSPKLLSSISRILRNIKFCSWLALENILQSLSPTLLRLCETYNAFQLPVFSFSFFCQTCPGLRNCKSVLILKTSQYGEPMR